MMFTADLAVDRVPSIRAIRNAQHFGQPRAQRLREFLAAVVETHGETWLRNRRSANSQRRACGRPSLPLRHVSARIRHRSLRLNVVDA